MSLRIGIDVGGTNTDAVLMDGLTVVSKIKTPTTPDVTTGITTALHHILESSGTATAEIAGVMIGTTHFTNAVVERKRLEPTAAVRLGLPATLALPPMVDWPDDLAEVLGRHAYLCHGGHEFDGREISPLDPERSASVAQEIVGQEDHRRRHLIGLLAGQHQHGSRRRRRSSARAGSRGAGHPLQRYRPHRSAGARERRHPQRLPAATGARDDRRLPPRDRRSGDHARRSTSPRTTAR